MQPAARWAPAMVRPIFFTAGEAPAVALGGKEKNGIMIDDRIVLFQQEIFVAAVAPSFAYLLVTGGRFS